MALGSWSWATRGLFLVTVVAWGFNYLFVNVGLLYASPLWLATVRAGVGATATAVLLTPLGQWGKLDARGRRDAMLLGIPNTAFFFAFWFSAARSVLPGVVAVLIYTFPLWVALLSPFVLGHRLSARHWGSIAFGFLGVALISQAWASFGSTVSPRAVLELLAAALCWGAGTVLFQRRFHRSEMLEANAFQLFGGLLVLLVLTLVFTPLPIPDFTPDFWATALWMGVLGTAVAYTVWFDLLSRTRAATLSAYVFLVPVVALVASAAFFSERLSPLQILGVGLVLLSIYGIGRARWEESPGESAEPA